MTVTDTDPNAKDQRRKMNQNEKNEAKEAKEIEVSEESIKKIENFLKGYKFNRRLLMMKNYEDKYFDTCEWESESPVEFALARGKMYEVRHFILNMVNSDEKLFLYYHYVRGETVERCAELLGISRSSGFRLKRRAPREAYISSTTEKNKLDLNRY